MPNPTKTVDLRKYSKPGVGVLAGRDRGAFVRREERLDRIDADPGACAAVIIPEWVFSVNSSFFLALFSESIRVLGPDVFRKRYVFQGPNAEEVREEGIRRALLVGLPLPSVARIA